MTMKRIRPRLVLSILIILVSLSGSTLFNRSRIASPLNIDQIPALALESYQRLLIVAPHPDDEVLGAGGLIQVALKDRIAVQVVIVTNGDGQLFAPGLLDRRLAPRSENYIALGKRRQVEALAALDEIGIDKKSVIFLGYPDRGLSRLWLENWDSDCPQKNWYTSASRNPYSITYRQDSSYCGNGVFDDLLEIISRFRPDLIVIPHPNDDHPDHQAASSFARFAVEQLELLDPEYKTQLFGYLVHYGYYPSNNRPKKSSPLLPPSPLTPTTARWVRLDLSPSERDQKEAALNQYWSQMRLMGGYLKRFIRRNELFIELDKVDLSLFEFSDIDLFETEDPATIQIAEPERESMRRVVAPGTDIIGWKMIRLGDTLFLRAEMRGNLIPGVHYRIFLKTNTGETFIYTLEGKGLTTAARSITAHIQLKEIGDPTIIGFAAETVQGARLDWTGWTVAELKQNMEP